RRRGELGASGRPVRASRRSGHGPPRGSRGHLPRRPAAPRRPLAGARRHPQGHGRRRLGHLLRLPYPRRVHRGGPRRRPARGGGLGGAPGGAPRRAGDPGRLPHGRAGGRGGETGGGGTRGTMRYATRTRVAPEAGSGPPRGPPPSRGTVLVVVLAAFAGLVVGVLRYRWGFDEMAALFFVMGVVAGLCGGLGVGGTAAAFGDGFMVMAYAAVLLWVAVAIYVALDQGRIVDTIVRGLFTPVAGLPLPLSALGM